tara:strand:+ start:1283 stop:1522 length:240 start_codon:yes stop_codon:yes gene_type:complete
MNYTQFKSKDGRYRMLPMDSMVWFKEISSNNTIIDEIKGPGRVIKQTIKWGDINYLIEYPIKSANYIKSRASVIFLSSS